MVSMTVAAALSAACAKRETQPPRAVSEYVDARTCAGCRPAHAKTFRETGMGRAFSRATPANMVENFERGASFYHQKSDRHYQMIRRGERYFLKRWQIHSSDRGEPPVANAGDVVPGEGRVLCAEPGYDRADYFDFRRKISYACFFCHNAYPEVKAGSEGPGADPIYPARLPEGIDCQRCHGPGRAHADAAQAARPAEELKKRIVNPARLSAERQMEVCMQCHLETTSFSLPGSLLRYDRGAFSFRPGQPLSEHVLHFDHAKGAGHDDKFEIVSAAYRLRQSACFQRSSGALVCTTCHNPHQALRGEKAVAHYAAACRKCHGPALAARVAKGRHPAGEDCARCHLPKRRTEDVVHAAVTDHRILKRRPGRDLLAPLAERHEVEGRSYRGQVVLNYPASPAAPVDADLYLAAAQMAQKSNPSAGIRRLEAAVEKHRPQGPEFYLDLAQAYLEQGKTERAMATFEEALRRNPKFVPALRSLGSASLKAGETGRAVAALERARAADPRDPPTLHELARAYHQTGRAGDAAAMLRESIRLDPDVPEVHNSLGNILALARDGRSGQGRGNFTGSHPAAARLRAGPLEPGKCTAGEGGIRRGGVSLPTGRGASTSGRRGAIRIWGGAGQPRALRRGAEATSRPRSSSSRSLPRRARSWVTCLRGGATGDGHRGNIGRRCACSRSSHAPTWGWLRP